MRARRSRATQRLRSHAPFLSHFRWVGSVWRFGPLQFTLFVFAALILGLFGIVGIYLRFLTVLVSLAVCSARAAVEGIVGRLFASESDGPVSMPLAKSYAEER